jgi:hypothetical protein
MISTRRNRYRTKAQRRKSMAKPIRATPTVTGAMAKKIQRELREGTPDTPQREATIKRADEAFRRHIEPILKNPNR